MMLVLTLCVPQHSDKKKEKKNVFASPKSGNNKYVCTNFISRLKETPTTLKEMHNITDECKKKTRVKHETLRQYTVVLNTICVTLIWFNVHDHVEFFFC